MRTNFQMVRDFSDYMPERRGFTSNEETQRIAEHFGLAEMTALEHIRCQWLHSNI